MSTPVIDLLSPGGPPAGPWTAGTSVPLPERRRDQTAVVADHLASTTADALLFWDPRLGPPPAAAVLIDLLHQPDDVWHAGLALGTGGQPAAIDLVAPTWMLNADPAPDAPATSWRLSLVAALVRTPVVRDLGFVDPHFASATAADLELGHRWIQHGARCRHQPDLLDGTSVRPPLDPIVAEDQLRFVQRRFGSRWAAYAALRSPGRRQGLRRLRAIAAEEPVAAGRRDAPDDGAGIPPGARRVSVIIPTVDRYPWLRTVLTQLGEQSVAPDEVMVVDQTPPERRRAIEDLAPPSLPVRALTSDVAGQCRARNLAIRAATGDLFLFLDDDDEIPPDLIERHLDHLGRSGADANCGVALEPGEGRLDAAFRHHRTSDVFPTNNTLLRREALEGVGLFDLAFDRGERADHDLGTRLYLAGRRLALDPDVEVLHHHAPQGGLRAHAARVSTYRRARSSLTARQALAPTEVYLWRRHFRPDQVTEAIRLRLVGTFSHRGGVLLRLVRALVQLLLLPDTRRRQAAAVEAADELGHRHPTIPDLPPGPVAAR